MIVRLRKENGKVYAKLDTTYSDDISDYEMRIEYTNQTKEQLEKELKDEYIRLAETVKTEKNKKS